MKPIKGGIPAIENNAVIKIKANIEFDLLSKTKSANLRNDLEDGGIVGLHERRGQKGAWTRHCLFFFRFAFFDLEEILLILRC